MRSLGLLTAIMIIAPTCSLFIASTVRAQTNMQAVQPQMPYQQPAAAPVMPSPSMQQPAAQPAYVPAAQPAAMQQAPATFTPAIDSIGGGAIPSLPLDVYTSNGINFINGGIGDEEMDQLKSKEHEFNLHVMLSASKGEYISDVTLRILDSKDTPLVAISDAGPYFYASMKAGSYTLETTALSGEKKRSKFTIPEKGVVKQHVVYNE